MPPLKNMHTRALESDPGDRSLAAALLASLRLSRVLRMEDEPIAAQLNWRRNDLLEIGDEAMVIGG
jgi:predicted solute-binding protein